MFNKRNKTNPHDKGGLGGSIFGFGESIESGDPSGRIALSEQKASVAASREMFGDGGEEFKKIAAPAVHAEIKAPEGSELN